MPHDLTTANRHDHAITKNWAQNICTLEHANIPLELRCEGRQHERRDCYCTTKVKCKIYQTCCALLDVGFVFILKRTSIFILIWACTAVLLNSTTVIFQIIQAFKKLLYTLSFFCHVALERCSETFACDAVRYDLSRSQNLQWWSTLRVRDPMRVWVEGVQRSLTRFMVFKGLISRRSQQFQRFLGRQGFPREVMASRV